ncbi:MAG: hypothetical protein LBE06_03285 [Azoarcus sp.]|jgi:hypothetical protein|nr:hypothetical protein [Azoarcus sp.]
MWIFTDIADWFDKKKEQANRVLDEAVEDDYNTGVMVIAAGTHAVMEFAGSFVDLLRLGDGVKQGGWRGWGADGLRAVVIFPVGKAAQIARSAKGLKAAKAVKDIGGPTCAWVAGTKGLVQIEHKLSGYLLRKTKPGLIGKVLVEVKDLGKAVGLERRQLGGVASLGGFVWGLRLIGAKIGPVKAVSSVKEVERMVPFDGSVVLTAVKGVVREGQDGAGKTVGHMVYFFREWGGMGRVRIMDRTVGEGQKTYASLAEFVEPYKVTQWAPYEAAVLHNVFAHSVLHDLPKLLIPIPAVVATYEEE